MKFITIIVAVAFIAMLSVQAGQVRYHMSDGKGKIVTLSEQGDKTDAVKADDGDKGGCGACENDKDAPKDCPKVGSNDGDKDQAGNGDKDKDKVENEKDKAGKGKGKGGHGKGHGKKNGEGQGKDKEVEAAPAKN